jgi:hypothetical protein
MKHESSRATGNIIQQKARKTTSEYDTHLHLILLQNGIEY